MKEISTKRLEQIVAEPCKMGSIPFEVAQEMAREILRLRKALDSLYEASERDAAHKAIQDMLAIIDEALEEK